MQICNFAWVEGRTQALRVFENRVLRKIFGRKWDKVMELVKTA
jgi:hypothetical protein